MIQNAELVPNTFYNLDDTIQNRLHSTRCFSFFPLMCFYISVLERSGERPNSSIVCNKVLVSNHQIICPSYGPRLAIYVQLFR